MVKGLRFCMRGSSFQHRVISRQYWNLVMKMGMMVAGGSHLLDAYDGDDFGLSFHEVGWEACLWGNM